MKTIELRDHFSGRPLNIEFELDQNNLIISMKINGVIVSMKINGVIVERKTALEDNDDVYIYGPISPSILEIVHLNKSQLDQMRAL